MTCWRVQKIRKDGDPTQRILTSNNDAGSIMPGDGPVMPGDGPIMPGDGPIMA